MDPVPIVAALIAFFALGVALWEGIANRNHNKLSVRPHLTFFQSMAGTDGLVGLRLRNHGLGPAIISHMTISIDGGPKLEASVEVWLRVVGTQNLDLDSCTWLVTIIFDREEAIGRGEHYDVICIPEAQRTPERINQLVAILKRIGITVEYKSIYNKKWCVSWKYPLPIVPPESNATE